MKSSKVHTRLQRFRHADIKTWSIGSWLHIMYHGISQYLCIRSKYFSAPIQDLLLHFQHGCWSPCVQSMSHFMCRWQVALSGNFKYARLWSKHRNAFIHSHQNMSNNDKLKETDFDVIIFIDSINRDRKVNLCQSKKRSLGWWISAKMACDVEQMACQSATATTKSDVLWHAILLDKNAYTEHLN